MLRLEPLTHLVWLRRWARRTLAGDDPLIVMDVAVELGADGGAVRLDQALVPRVEARQPLADHWHNVPENVHIHPCGFRGGCAREVEVGEESDWLVRCVR